MIKFWFIAKLISYLDLPISKAHILIGYFSYISDNLKNFYRKLKKINFCLDKKLFLLQRLYNILKSKYKHCYTYLLLIMYNVKITNVWSVLHALMENNL